jgi:hypothetical protein
MKKFLFFLFFIPALSWGDLIEIDGFLLDEYKGAVCNSGSPATYYLKKQDPKKWVLFMQRVEQPHLMKPIGLDPLI